MAGYPGFWSCPLCVSKVARRHWGPEIDSQSQMTLLQQAFFHWKLNTRKRAVFQQALRVSGFKETTCDCQINLQRFQGSLASAIDSGQIG